jgi:DNA processing protein
MTPSGSRSRSDLALAVFASETGTHLVRPPHDARWAVHLHRFDERAYRERLTAARFRFLPRSAAEFPPLLRSIHDPPPGLFLRGEADPELLSRPAVAIVGARACSGYGASVARSLGRELGAAGLVVVSGLARGVDGEAHRGALDAGGPTVAVLGCGIDRDYPAAHAELARRVAGAGLIVSEYAPGVEPAPWRFPARNRIVAGLSAAVVVVEARERSGALITADLALEEGREVFAVPGEITSALSEGSNTLLKLGASPLTGAGDLLSCFGLEATAAEIEVGGIAADLLGFVREQPVSADELARRAGLGAGEVARALVELELAGLALAADGLYRAVEARAPAAAPTGPAGRAG